MQEHKDIPTEEQTTNAQDRIIEYGNEFDSLLGAYESGRISREGLKAIWVARITAGGAREDRLQERIGTDKLTNLLNRAGFDREYKKAIEQLKRGGESAVLVNIDVDGLKEINDSGGHLEGDKLLKKIGVVLTKYTRLTDSAAILTRHGGDEFMVILRNTNQKGAEKWWERISHGFEEQHLRASVGSVEINPNDPEESIRLADSAMYAAKQLKGDGKSHYMQIRQFSDQINPVEIIPTIQK